MYGVCKSPYRLLGFTGASAKIRLYKSVEADTMEAVRGFEKKQTSEGVRQSKWQKRDELARLMGLTPDRSVGWRHDKRGN